MSDIAEEKPKIDLIGQDEIYHYCSFETFINIIQNQKIRLSDLSKTNDPREIVFYSKKLVDYNKNLDFFVNQLISNYIYLSFSLSKIRDCKKMWKKYCPKGGICIVFYSEYIEKLARKIQIRSELTLKAKCPLDTKFCFLKNIQYFDKKRISAEAKKDSGLKSFDDWCFVKHKKWSHENEVRMLIKFDSDDTSEQRCSGVIIDYQDYVLHFSDRIYCDIFFDPKCIKEIIIGPGSRFSKKEIDNLLFVNNNKGYVFETSISKYYKNKV